VGDDALRIKMVELVSRLFDLANDTHVRSQGQVPVAESYRYWQGVSFGLEMAVGDVLTIIEALTQSHEGTEAKLDDLRANLIETASRFSHLAEKALQRGHNNSPVVATQDYWQGVAFGLTIATGEVLNLIMDTSRHGVIS
jgi:predicted DNA-binding ArsR family transcriptional regulator